MKFVFTIVYVNSVPEVLSFYESAFGLKTRFMHESKQYGELETGETVLAFASHEMGQMNLQGKYHRTDVESEPLGIEIAFVTDNIETAFEKAVNAGATAISEPDKK